MRKILPLRLFQLNSALIIILFSGRAILPSAADTLTLYRIRTDQQLDLSPYDRTMGQFWSDFENRTSFTATCNRSITELQKDDGNVTITVKAGATLSDVYLLFLFSYENRAPCSDSSEIPIDRFSFSLFRDSISRIAYEKYPEYRRIFFPLRETSRKVKGFYVKLDPDDPRPGIFDSDIDGEVIEIDSATTAVEITFPAQYLDQMSGFIPHPGVHRAIDMRYYPSNEDPSHDTIAEMFRAGDSGVFAYRLFLGEVFIDEHFDDSVYVITSPRSSTRLIAGTYHTVTWGYTAQGGVLGLDYSPDDGTEWFTFSAATANDGAQPWRIPPTTSDAFRVRIRKGETVVALSELFSVGCPVPRLLPVPDSVGRVLFQWERVVNAASYRIQVDTAPDFIAPFIDDTIQSTEYQSTAALPFGRLYWKVASDIDFETFSATDSFINVKSTAVHDDLMSSVRTTAGITQIGKGRIIYKVSVPTVISIDLVSISGKTVHTMYSGYRRSGVYKLSTGTVPRPLATGIHLLRYRSGTTAQIIPYIFFK